LELIVEAMCLQRLTINDDFAETDEGRADFNTEAVHSDRYKQTKT
jgi:hypothetical protein